MSDTLQFVVKIRYRQHKRKSVPCMLIAAERDDKLKCVGHAAALQSCVSSLHHLTCCAMSFKIINPASLGNPKGYSNGLIAPSSRKQLFVSGQVAWNQEQQIISDDFVEQFDKALANFMTVVAEAGGAAGDVVRLIMYVTEIDEYRSRTKEIGERYRRHMGKHFPAMVLVEVKGLLDAAAKVEIEGVALLNE